eukprot:4210378-Prymnesium_polylepis.1
MAAWRVEVVENVACAHLHAGLEADVLDGHFAWPKLQRRSGDVTEVAVVATAVSPAAPAKVPFDRPV